MLTNVKLGKNMRSVSIVGIGATPFFNGVENPTYQGLTNGELLPDTLPWKRQCSRSPAVPMTSC